MDESPIPPIDPTVARTIGKLRAFLAGLEPAERSVMAALLAPAAQRATASARWTPTALRELLSETDDLRGRHSTRR